MEFILAIDPCWRPGQMMPNEIMYNYWKDKKLNTKILQWYEKEVMPEPDTVLKPYFDKDSVTQVYDSVREGC
jgi:hypothetical protein